MKVFKKIPQKTPMQRWSTVGVMLLVVVVLFMMTGSGEEPKDKSNSRLVTSANQGPQRQVDTTTKLTITAMVPGAEASYTPHFSEAATGLPVHMTGRAATFMCERKIPALTIDNNYKLPESYEQAMKSHEAFIKSTFFKMARVVGVSPPDGMLLQQLVQKVCTGARKKHGSCNTLETGFALGASTIAMLNGHDEAYAAAKSSYAKQERGLHYSDDPFHTTYLNVGARGVIRYLTANPSSSVDAFHIDETAAVGMGHLYKQKQCFDFVFLDDGHRFEQNIMELSLAVDMTAVGGVIVMHDTQMTSIKATRSWVETNLYDSIKILDQTVSNIMLVMLKVDQDTRAFTHFKPFETNFKTEIVD